MAASFQDARQYERASVREPVVLLLFGERYPGLVTRLGGGGVYIETLAPAERDDPVLLRLRLPCFNDPLTLKGEVRWAATESLESYDEPGRPPINGLGVMFRDMDSDVQQSIVEYVAETGNVLYEVSGLLQDTDPDLARIQYMLGRINLDAYHSVDELRERLREEMRAYFKRF